MYTRPRDARGCRAQWHTQADTQNPFAIHLRLCVMVLIHMFASPRVNHEFGMCSTSPNPIVSAKTEEPCWVSFPHGLAVRHPSAFPTLITALLAHPSRMYGRSHSSMAACLGSRSPALLNVPLLRTSYYLPPATPTSISLFPLIHT